MGLPDLHFNYIACHKQVWCVQLLLLCQMLASCQVKNEKLIMPRYEPQKGPPLSGSH